MRDAPRNRSNPLAWKYDYDPAAVPAATRRVADLLSLFAARLRDQHALGSRYLVGNTLTAVDIYWATFAAMLRPLPADLCPMPDWMRPMYDLTATANGPAVAPILLAHRDFVYETHLQLPMDF
jgi:glutathione S-transferase